MKCIFQPAAAVGMGEGLPEYAAIVIDEARNGPDARRRRIVEYLRSYDDARSGIEEVPLGETMMGDPIGQRRIALAKAPLFFVALEDACGDGADAHGYRESCRPAARSRSWLCRFAFSA